MGQKSFCAAAPPNGDSVITTGFDSAAQIHPVEIDYAATHTDIVLDVRGTASPFSYPLVGRFNVENVMTAFAVGMQLGISTGSSSRRSPTFRRCRVVSSA